MFLLDIYSDATMFGGMSETSLELQDDALKLQSTFVKDDTGLVKIDYQFCGFRCVNLVQKNYDYFNGFRITMRQP